MGEALDAAIRILSGASVPGARHDAEHLLALLLGTDRGGLYVRRADPLDAATVARYRTWVERRRRREPLQHLTGEQAFCGRIFKTDSRALIPRPETELLVEAALDADLPARARVVDLGTGSGCIAISLALARTGWVVDALDASEEALDLARENAEAHGVGDRVAFVRGDLADPPGQWNGGTDLVVSNPPYVSAGDWAGLQPEVRDHDPRLALVAGPTGLEAYQALVPAAWSLLRPGGFLMFEMGFGQWDALRELVTSRGFERIEVRDDMQGIPRVLAARRPRRDVRDHSDTFLG